MWSQRASHHPNTFACVVHCALCIVYPNIGAMHHNTPMDSDGGASVDNQHQNKVAGKGGRGKKRRESDREGQIHTLQLVRLT